MRVFSVPRAGVEPARIAPLVFETSASTDSAIWASKLGQPLTKKALRREGDSNPRYGYPYDSLANCWFQPLTHLSSGRFAEMRYPKPLSRHFKTRKADAKVLQYFYICKFSTLPRANFRTYFFNLHTPLAFRAIFCLHITPTGKCKKCATESGSTWGLIVVKMGFYRGYPRL